MSNWHQREGEIERFDGGGRTTLRVRVDDPDVETRSAHDAADPPRLAPKRVVRRARSGTGEQSSSRSHTRRLPSDVLAQASKRLEVIALLAAVLWTVLTILYHLVDRAFTAGDPSWLSLRSSDGVAAVGVATSLALYVYLRRAPRDPRKTLDLGLLYMISTAAIAGVIQHWDPVPDSPTMPMVSWTGVMILLVAATLPNEPHKTVVAGLIAASMNPLGMLLARARGTWPFDSAVTAWTMHYPDFLVVGASLIVARVVTGLGEQVARAREMGSYELGTLIGHGGMGEVYKATHRMLARPAAIKLIRPEILAARTGEQADLAVERFHREADAAARLQSPHTVGLYDFGATEDGTLYFAMELLDGMDLESLVRGTGPLPAARVVHILRQVCESLEEAHASGLVHRDIKPANLHIGRFGLRHDFVKVLDFGLVTTAGTRHESVTGAGTITGTPAYLAPEMIVGDKVDGRADLYALGCVAYYLLTGHLVFGSDTALQNVVKRLHEAPPRPSTRTGLPIPFDLEAVVLSCLATQPEDRPASARELARMLVEVNVEPWTDEHARAWWAARGAARVIGP
jgi:serine/threonine-protein kinase